MKGIGYLAKICKTRFVLQKETEISKLVMKNKKTHKISPVTKNVVLPSTAHPAWPQLSAVWFL